MTVTPQMTFLFRSNLSRESAVIGRVTADEIIGRLLLRAALANEYVENCIRKPNLGSCCFAQATTQQRRAWCRLL